MVLQLTIKVALRTLATLVVSFSTSKQSLPLLSLQLSFLALTVLIHGHAPWNLLFLRC